jgi:hypothetical protein
MERPLTTVSRDTRLTRVFVAGGTNALVPGEINIPPGACFGILVSFLFRSSPMIGGSSGSDALAPQSWLPALKQSVPLETFDDVLPDHGRDPVPVMPCLTQELVVDPLREDHHSLAAREGASLRVCLHEDDAYNDR